MSAPIRIMFPTIRCCALPTRRWRRRRRAGCGGWRRGWGGGWSTGGSGAEPPPASERGLASDRGQRLVEIRDQIVGIFRSEEHTSELQSLMRISYAVFCLKNKNTYNSHT